MNTRLTFQNLSCQPITRSIGAEVSGFSITDAGPEIFDQLQQALLHYKVLFLREQVVSVVQLCKFSRGIGPLMRVPYIAPMYDHPDVIAVLKESDEINMGVFGGDWHSDFSVPIRDG